MDHVRTNGKGGGVMNIEELQQDVEDLTRNCNRLFDENRELKQQLAEKEKKSQNLKKQ